MSQIQFLTGRISGEMKTPVKQNRIIEFPFYDMGNNTYTKEEVDLLIEKAVETAVAEAKRIDEESMSKHNRDATIISMILGFTCLALFVDGLLRILGIIPPFMDLDVNILERIVSRVETDVIHKLKLVPNPFR
jgi:hypothetical protein